MFFIPTDLELVGKFCYKPIVTWAKRNGCRQPLWLVGERTLGFTQCVHMTFLWILSKFSAHCFQGQQTLLLMLFDLVLFWFDFGCSLNPIIVRSSFSSSNLLPLCLWDSWNSYYFFQFWGQRGTYLNLSEMRTMTVSGRVTGN